MDMNALQTIRELFQQQLLNSVEPFWTGSQMLDRKNGGVFTSLDRAGNVYSTDKSVWFQGRCLWTYSDMMAHYGEKPEWMEICRSCREFMEKHCFDSDGRMFFTVTAEGKPLRKRRYFFSETFFVLGMAEFSRVTGDKSALEEAKRVYDLLISIYHEPAKDPFKITPKSDPETRAMKAMANPMILLNVNTALRRADPENRDFYDALADEYTTEIVRDFRKKDLSCALENVGLQGEFYSDISAGRLVNPGHSLECSWFLLNEANERGDEALKAEALSLMEDSLNIGWDQVYGGIRYFADALDRPVVELECDMKLWWPQNEAILATLLAWKTTGEEKYAQWFMKAVEYTLDHFPDPDFGEWFGYLHRDGTVSHTYKGSTFKGPFHIFRMLSLAIDWMDEMILLA